MKTIKKSLMDSFNDSKSLNSIELNFIYGGKDKDGKPTTRMTHYADPFTGETWDQDDDTTDIV